MIFRRPTMGPSSVTIARRPLAAVLVTVLLVGLPSISWAWGYTTHRMLNRAATDNLPPAFAPFAQWVDTIEELAVAADDRKCCDPDESRRHYCDIDDYPEFFAGTLPLTFDGMVTMYGLSRVNGNGTVPWTINDNYELLVQHFLAEDWTAAVEIAADIGHYAGDMHNPMHLTLNYNGQLTGQYGIHSRHESQMTGDHIDELIPTPTVVSALPNILESVYSWIDVQYPGVAMILAADLVAEAAAGGSTSNSTYRNTLWQEIGPETDAWLQQASEAIAAIWYTAWLEAGSPTLPGSPVATVPSNKGDLTLHPVYPNPFNPATTISFEVARTGTATITIHDVNGHLVRTLFDGEVALGMNSKLWNGRDNEGKSMASGIYLVRVAHNGSIEQQKAVLVQ